MNKTQIKSKVGENKKTYRTAPYAFFMIEGDGIMAIGCKTRERAIKEILELWNDDAEYNTQEHGDINKAIQDLKEQRAYRCSNCGMNWIDENRCWDCDIGIGGIGKRCFVIYF